jgi:hypothetical protein
LYRPLQDTLTVAYLHDPDQNRGKFDAASVQHFARLLSQVADVCTNDQEPI